MKFIHRASVVLLLLVASLPLFAAKSADVMVPVVGVVTLPNDLVYRTELVLTNHRDIPQYVQLSFVQDGYDARYYVFQLGARATSFLPTAGFATSTSGQTNRIGGLRIRAIKGVDQAYDPLGQIEANAFIVADRGKFAKHGSSRQEVAGIASEEYFKEEATFVGIRHSYGTGAYTNVGVVNMHPTQTETFFVEFQDGEPTQVVVPPNSLRQIRLPGDGNGGRTVRVYPEWAMGDGQPLRTTPWVAYASTVDMKTGDAFSGMLAASRSAVTADLALPITGFLDLPDDLVYRTELVVTNHRDVAQAVQLELVMNGETNAFRTFELQPRETKFFDDGAFGDSFLRTNFVGAMRVRALTNGELDPAGKLEANAFIVAERALGARGSTRQEIAGIASNEYFAEDAVFLGVRHSYGTGAYTNVGIVNLHPTQTETFFVRFQYAEPVAVVVPPNSLRQIRLPGEGHGGRYVHVYPEWSIGNGAPARTTPWLAYSSTVDLLTGDAFSGMRVPSDTKYRFPDLD